MSAYWAETLPLALAIAASPLTIIPAILLLFTSRPRATSAAFLLGWLLGIVIPTTVAVLLATVIDGWDESPAWIAWLRIAIGAVLVALGVRQWLTRRTPKPPPRWMATISSATPRSALRLAFVLALVNPKVLLLSLAAGLAIGRAEPTVSQAVSAVVVFTVVASLSVALPLLLFVVLGDRMLHPLGRARDWLQRHNAAVMSIVLVVIGAIVAAEGLSSLS